MTRHQKQASPIAAANMWLGVGSYPIGHAANQKMMYDEPKAIARFFRVFIGTSHALRRIPCASRLNNLA